MKSQIKKVKTIAEELSVFRSEAFMELYFDMVEFFNDYFEKQAIEYIQSLGNYPELKLNKSSNDDVEKFMKKLSLVHMLWQSEADDSIIDDLIKVWNWAESITISNKYALEYAEKQAGLSLSMIDQTTSTTINSIITTGIKESQTVENIATQIKEKFADYTLYRSTLIATMEISQAYWQWEKKQYDEYTKTLWVIWYKRSATQKDSNVRESHKANEDAGWIPRDQVYPGTGTMNAPHDFMCRCHDINSITNPDTGMLYDKVPDYKEEQIEKLEKYFWKLWDLWELSINEKEKIWSYSLKSEEALSLKKYSSWASDLINTWYKNWSWKEQYQGIIPFFIGALNKLPKYEWKVFRWHKTTAKEFEKLSNLVAWDLFSYNTFFSSSKDKKIAKKFFTDDYKVLFEIDTKKWRDISDFWHESEKEVLFLPKTLFRIEKVENKNNILIIYLSDL